MEVILLNAIVYSVKFCENNMVHKSYLLVTFIFCLPYFTFGQHEFCGQHIVTEQIFKSYPQSKSDYLKFVQRTLQDLKNGGIKSSNRNSIKYTIPVVFHILHDNGSENISNEQVFDQIRILNRDYQKQNADTAKVVASFSDNIANVGFEFVLAKTDPDGRCTNGINRYRTKKTIWDANELDDFIYSWPTDQYLNIYVVKKINIAPAYTFLPGTPIPANADVIVCESNYVGSIGTAVFDSRAITHEVGHWFGLPHIWGLTNAPGVACGDDFVADTPLTKGFTTCSPYTSKVCNNHVEENFQNYMDYAPCKYMFTKGQSSYMVQTIESNINGRSNLVSQNNLIATGIIFGQSCRTKADFEMSTGSICTGEKMRLTSFSSTGDKLIDLNWEISGPETLTAKDSILEATFNIAGIYFVKLLVSGPNGSDSITKSFRVYNGENGIIPTKLFNFSNDSQFYDFESYNIDNDLISWRYENNVGADENPGCLLLENFNSSLSGARHYIETPFFNFTNISKPQMSFYYSFARLADEQNDTFKIEYTLDCGTTWKPISMQLTTLIMANNTGGFTSDYFIPSKPDHWKKLTISNALYPILRYKPSVKFRFYFRTDNQLGISNNLYIDELKIWDAAVTSLSNINSKDKISIVPNPSSFELSVNLSINISDVDQYFIKDNLGNTIETEMDVLSEEGNVIFRINQRNQLSAGIYQFVVLKKDGTSIVGKLCII